MMNPMSMFPLVLAGASFAKGFLLAHLAIPPVHHFGGYGYGHHRRHYGPSYPYRQYKAYYGPSYPYRQYK